jgi:hypothetical protein
MNRVITLNFTPLRWHRLQPVKNYSLGSKYPNAYNVPSCVPTNTLLCPDEIEDVA